MLIESRTITQKTSQKNIPKIDITDLKPPSKSIKDIADLEEEHLQRVEALNDQFDNYLQKDAKEKKSKRKT